MILSEDVKNKFKELLGQIPEWKNLVDSQFVEKMAVFAGWLVEHADYSVERAYQEAFYDSALNRSSLLAHAEGLSYVSAKPEPAQGKALFVNGGEQNVELVRDREFMSDAQVIYTLEESITIPAGGQVTASVSQRSKGVYEFTVEHTQSFYEYLFPQDVSPNIVSMRVFVDEQDGNGFYEYDYDYLLTNSFSDTRCYDEFYHFTDQLGVRFGNGTFGKQLEQGWQVRIETVETDGDTLLLEKQSLWPVEEIKDVIGLTAQVEITVSQTIQNGQNQEDTETLRRNLHYASVYNDRLVWDQDFNYFLRRRYRDIVFAKAWGEDKAEEMWGINVDWINKVWICAYSPERDIKELAMQAVKEIPSMNRHYVWHDPEHIEFWLEIRGKVLQNQPLSEVEQAIRDTLQAHYGKASTTRRDQVFLHEIYSDISSTGYFAQNSSAWFEVKTFGQYEAQYIYQMISINLDKTIISLEYVK